mmetsp:Transcript_21697/g.50082  ORF Transcript_21697/g.50082 Transcript_21697/m.50082 type:complete len:90 (-) Transcript_21697:128-397(-)
MFHFELHAKSNGRQTTATPFKLFEIESTEPIESMVEKVLQVLTEGVIPSEEMTLFEGELDGTHVTEGVTDGNNRQAQQLQATESHGTLA